MEKTNISVILAVHELTDETKNLFTNAVQSVKEQLVRPDELVIVVPKNSDAASYVKAFDNISVIPYHAKNNNVYTIINLLFKS
jgi:hypothetical protein